MQAASNDAQNVSPSSGMHVMSPSTKENVMSPNWILSKKWNTVGAYLLKLKLYSMKLQNDIKIKDIQYF